MNTLSSPRIYHLPRYYSLIIPQKQRAPLLAESEFGNDGLVASKVFVLKIFE
jgi:hypothetical protein